MAAHIVLYQLYMHFCVRYEVLATSSFVVRWEYATVIEIKLKFPMTVCSPRVQTDWLLPLQIYFRLCVFCECFYSFCATNITRLPVKQNLQLIVFLFSMSQPRICIERWVCVTVTAIICAVLLHVPATESVWVPRKRQIFHKLESLVS